MIKRTVKGLARGLVKQDSGYVKDKVGKAGKNSVY